jgi:hypothetical protein
MLFATSVKYTIQPKMKEIREKKTRKRERVKFVN